MAANQPSFIIYLKVPNSLKSVHKPTPKIAQHASSALTNLQNSITLTTWVPLFPYPTIFLFFVYFDIYCPSTNTFENQPLAWNRFEFFHRAKSHFCDPDLEWVNYHWRQQFGVLHKL